MSISFDEYQEATMETAIYPEAGEGSELALAYVALGLAGEAGEVANKVKKVIRDTGGNVTEEQFETVKKEVGDVLWYAARLCDELGISFDQAATLNINKLAVRKQHGTIGGDGDSR